MEKNHCVKPSFLWYFETICSFYKFTTHRLTKAAGHLNLSGVLSLASKSRQEVSSKALLLYMCCDPVRTPFHLLAALEPGTQPAEFPWCLYCTWPLGGGIPKVRKSSCFKREKDIKRKRKTFVRKIEKFSASKEASFFSINTWITEEWFQETLWLL